MIDADFRVLLRAPDDAIAAHVVKQECADTERSLADLGIPHEESTGERSALTIAPAGYLNAVFLIGQEYEHVAIRCVQRGVGLGNRNILAEFAGYLEVTINAIPETL